MLAFAEDIIIYLIILAAIGFIGWMGQWGRTNRGARLFVYALIALISFICLATCLLGIFIFSGIIASPSLALHINLGPHLNLAPFGFLLMGIGSFAIISLIPTCRRLISKTIFKGLDPDVPAHTWALFVYLSAILFTVISITVFYSPRTVIESLKSVPLLLSVSLNAIGFLGFAFLAAGAVIYLPFKEILAQLGLTRISRKNAFLFIGAAILLWLSMQTLETFLLIFVSPQMKITLQEIVNAMRIDGGFMETLSKGLFVGLSAGIGEETLFRGLMQPIFGIVPTALLFALIHMHYGPTVLLLELFIVGIILGLVRKRFNTTAAIIIHSCFDFIAIVTSYIHH